MDEEGKKQVPMTGDFAEQNTGERNASLPLISVEKKYTKWTVSPFEEKQKALPFEIRTVYKTN